MIRQFYLTIIVFVQFAITSCTGYGLIYDDKRLASDDESTEYEQECLNKPNSECLLKSATAITDSITDDITRAEAWAVLAKAYFELGEQTATLNAIENIPVLALQFNTLFALSQTAKQQHKSTSDYLKLADTITQAIHRPHDKLAALLFSSILAFDPKQPQTALSRLKQAIAYAETYNGQNADQKTNIIDVGFFKTILPQLQLFATTEAINKLITLQSEAYLQISARVEYLLELKQKQPDRAQRLLDKMLFDWQNLQDKKQQKLAHAAIVKLLVRFNRLKQAKEIQRQTSEITSRIIISSVIIQQLVSKPKIAINMAEAKRQLVELLQQVRRFSAADTPGTQATIKQQRAAKQQKVQDQFILDNLRAQAIADVALGLSEMNKLLEAVHFAEQIQIRMGHIQGYTLTKLALHYARQGDFNSALLTMESIHRSVNRAACLAQISAEVARSGDLSRAIFIANRIDRQSWRDIALSEISITQAKRNNISTAIKTLDVIQRSYSAVYVMSQLAIQIDRTVQASQNKR